MWVESYICNVVHGVELWTKAGRNYWTVRKNTWKRIADIVYNQENRHMGRGTVNGVYFSQRSTLIAV